MISNLFVFKCSSKTFVDQKRLQIPTAAEGTPPQLDFKRFFSLFVDEKQLRIETIVEGTPL